MNFTPQIAIIKKEMLENKGGFIYAPAILTFLFFMLVILQSLFTNRVETIAFAHEAQIATFYVQATFFAIFALITLFFYFANSFSSDRKNNGLLFWKSMPMSDLNILSLKFVFGIIIVPFIIWAWVLIAAILTYLIGVINVASFGTFVDPWTAVISILQMGSTIIVVYLVALLWLAPFYAWVAFLSVFFKKWAIALAFVIPLVLIAMEEILSFDAFQTSIVAEFIHSRFLGIFDEAAFMNDSLLSEMENIEFSFEQVNEASFANLFLSKLYATLWQLLTHVKWLSLFIGLVISAVFIFIASEYRRKFIQG